MTRIQIIFYHGHDLNNLPLYFQQIQEAIEAEETTGICTEANGDYVADWDLSAEG